MIGNPAVANVIGVVASVLSLWMSVPQAWRIWRDRSYVGVSPLTWALFCLTFSLWTGYTLREGIWVGVAGNFLALLTASTILLGIHRCAPRPRDRWLGLLLALGVVSAAAIGHNAPAGVVIAAQFAAMGVRAPQVIASYRTMRTLGPSEVSRQAWWVSLASASCWSLYGITLPNIAIALVSPAVIVLSALVLTFEYAAASGRARLAAG